MVARVGEADKKLGRKLRMIRHMLDMDLHEMSEIFGVTYQQYLKYENGLNRISAIKLYAFSKHVNIHIDFFFE